MTVVDVPEIDSMPAEDEDEPERTTVSSGDCGDGGPKGTYRGRLTRSRARYGEPDLLDGDSEIDVRRIKDSAGLLPAGLRSAELSSTGLQSAGLSSAGLSSAGLQSAGLSSTGLQSAGLSSTGLQSAGLSSTGLQSAGLSSAGLSSAGLSSTGLQSARWSSAGLQSAGLSSAGLSSVGLRSAELSSAGLQSVGLSSAGLQSARLSSTGLHNGPKEQIIETRVGETLEPGIWMHTESPREGMQRAGEGHAELMDPERRQMHAESVRMGRMSRSWKEDFEHPRLVHAGSSSVESMRAGSARATSGLMYAESRDVGPRCPTREIPEERETRQGYEGRHGVTGYASVGQEDPSSRRVRFLPATYSGQGGRRCPLGEDYGDEYEDFSVDRRGRSPYGTRSLQSMGLNRGSTANRVSSRSISPSGRTRSRESRRDIGRPNMQPDRYDGSTPWSEYQAHFEFCAEINGWTDDECSLYLAAKLKGQAQKVLGDRRCRRGYRELVNLLSRSFGPGQHSEMYLAELRGRRRKTDESIQKMGLEIRRLAELAYPEMDDDARDRLSRMHFRDALENHEIRVALFQARPSTLEEAIEVATELDSYFEVEKTRPSKLRPQARIMISQDEEVAKLKEELARLQTRLNGEGKARRPRDLSEVVCYGCSQTGHYRRDCPQKNNNRSSGNGEAFAQRTEGRC